MYNYGLHLEVSYTIQPAVRRVSIGLVTVTYTEQENADKVFALLDASAISAASTTAQSSSQSAQQHTLIWTKENAGLCTP